MLVSHLNNVLVYIMFHSRLGKVVHKKNATALCFAGIRPEDKHNFNNLCDAVKNNYNERYDEIRYCII